MAKTKEDIIGELKTPSALNSRFNALLDSISGIRLICEMGNREVNDKSLIYSILNIIIDNLGAEEVFYYELENEKLTLKAKLSWGQDINDIDEDEFETHPCNLNKDVISMVTMNHEVININDTSSDSLKVINYNKIASKQGSIIYAPIRVNEDLLGVIELSHPDKNHFKNWQEHSISIYADVMALLIHKNKLLYNLNEQVEERTSELKKALDKVEKSRIRFEKMSFIDPLTKLYNRRYFFSEATASIARAKRYSQPLSLMIMDLDHFKKINDEYGHECGDSVLVDLSEILSQFTREGDTLARLGGEEFVLVLPETSSVGARTTAERIRDTVEHHEWFCDDKKMKITISIGIASLNCHEEDGVSDDLEIADILRKADRALYYVKQHGRNNIKEHSESI